jgi:hypothetical protein
VGYLKVGHIGFGETNMQGLLSGSALFPNPPHISCLCRSSYPKAAALHADRNVDAPFHAAGICTAPCAPFAINTAKKSRHPFVKWALIMGWSRKIFRSTKGRLDYEKILV